MNTKQNNKKFIPISSVEKRIKCLESYNLDYHPTHYFPLYESYNQIYNFENLIDSLKHWNNFSTSITTNINETCKLLKVIAKNGTIQELQDAVNVVNMDIIPYLRNPSEFKYNFSKLNEIKVLQPYVNEIIENINEQAECDRVINNYNLVCKRFNVDKLFKNMFNEIAIPDTLYTFCEWVDTYNLNLKTKYCIANEVALLAASKNYLDIPTRAIVENIIDYYIMQYNEKDIPKFIDTIQDAVNKDRFIANEALDYLKYIYSVYNKLDGMDYENEVLSHFNETTEISFVFEYDDYDNMKNAYKSVLSEIALVDKYKKKARELITKVKISPIKTVSMAKSTLSTTLESFPKEEVLKAVATVLKISFLILVTLGAFTLGLIAIILGFVGKLIWDRWFSNEAQIRMAIEEMKKHKEEVEYKYKTEPSSEKKARMLEYVKQLEIQIKELEVKCDEENKDASPQENENSKSTFDKAKEAGKSILNALVYADAIDDITDKL